MSITSPPSTQPEEDQPGPQPVPQEISAGRASLYRGFGPLLRRLHFYAGILVAPFLILVALTGLAYAFTPQIDQVAYHDQLHVNTVGTTRLPLSQQVAAAQQVVPAGTLAAIHPAAAPDATTKVEFSLPELGDKQRTVYLDPYTGQVRGLLTTWSGATPITTWLDQMHANLNLGDTGRLYSELAASWLWVLVLGGLILWWRQQRGTRTARRLLLPETTAGKGVRRTRSLHATAGIWLALMLLFLSATGLTWSQHAGANFDLLSATLNSDNIPLTTGLGATGPSAGDSKHHGSGGTTRTQADLDAIAASVETSRLSGPVTITPADEPGHAWTVAQTDNTWPVHRDKIAVHPHTGQIIDTVRWADQPPLAKLTTFGIQAHMGVLFGFANQIALALVAAGLIVTIGWGYRMWWQRRPTRHSHRYRLGTPPPRGTWRHLPIPALVITALAALAVGWAVPILGWTLLGFLILDAALALARHAQSHPATAQEPK
ncbi:PepSY-associated TM helix domain-containing protein [Micromonospora sp. L32]|uniref:PepSY-associated TM helix domain-containing protein n=1 Tax=Micromonospora sp. L32 TaxID=3452214 RepID=UPI003F8C0093